ncbi:hypothetical protein SAMN02799630_02264 [Paenibacillus sp. UNCCL117]|uniref:DUF6273 domain-containing protein n=1 Tax=unclassified Paenibacillus TaxID=185978 RepID=UPI00088AD819|nr:MULTISPECIES: DUF6273 domain-containing protein [unclassified Paenibacillus]SDD15593.1 hypothetical protein SAMN04488602_106140 [Paenibacillus sp. cl123]SFW34492.1 hypothetical protein SAMN02799630_02264 [Paenibacillus sp. UNCCL117]
MNKDELAQSYRNLKPGEWLTFGTYPQSADGGESAIQWRVLQNSGSELFVLSEYILDCKRYHGKTADLKWRDSMEITWHDCDLREWLNDEFYNAAFHAAEKQFIPATVCTDNGEGCPDTADKVFLLSAAEIKALTEVHGKELRRAAGTAFAKTKKPDGCSLYVYDKTNKDNYIVRDGEEAGCSWWWLRTQGNKPSRAFFIGPGCSIRSYGNNSIDGYGVRPALKINFS